MCYQLAFNSIAGAPSSTIGSKARKNMKSIHFGLEGCVLCENDAEVPSCFSPEQAEKCQRGEKGRQNIYEQMRRGVAAQRWRGGQYLWMMDERWKGLQTVRCSLYLSYAFLIRRLREVWMGEDWRQEGQRQKAVMELGGGQRGKDGENAIACVTWRNVAITSARL